MHIRSSHYVNGIRKKRAALALLAFLIAACILLINILRLDLFAYDEYKDKAYDQITTTSRLKAERGNIYDANMNVLATTKTTWRIFVSPKAIANHRRMTGEDVSDKIAAGVCEIFSLEYKTVKDKLGKSTVLDATIEAAATDEEYERLLDYVRKNELEDFIFAEAQSARYYPMGTLAAHVLGFTGSDNQGLYGLEYSYNSTLSGVDGYYLYAKDANGNPMPGSYNTLEAAKNGNSIVTTIDAYIQSELESQLAAIVENHSVTNRATGIVMDTKTGAILAMATSSPFDPNSPFELDELSLSRLSSSGYAEDSSEYKKLKSELMQIMWSNKAVSETYEPGSTFKIVTVAAALDSGAAKFTDKFSCSGYHSVGGYRIKCHKTTGHGSSFSLAYGLQMSCNPTMMQIAERTGAETFYSYVEKFGYFEETGIDLPSEAGTIFHKPDAIGSTELATASFGQRFKVSIIGQLTAIAAVANGGYLVTPYVVDRVIDENGNIVVQNGTEIKRQVISKEVAAEIAAVLEAGVSGEGGAKNAYVDGYAVAAKTGTSQKFDVLDANGNSYLRIGSTVAFAPSDGAGIAAIIVVDEPQSQVKYGATVAAPYISALLTNVLPYLEYERSGEAQSFEVESYVGLNVNSAKSSLSDSGISYEIIGDGSVILGQTPAAGIDIAISEGKVYLYTDERSTERITVPELIGLSAGEAARLAAGAGLNISLSGVRDMTRDCVRVVSQSLPPGAKVARGEAIVLTLMRTDFED